MEQKAKENPHHFLSVVPLSNVYLILLRHRSLLISFKTFTPFTCFRYLVSSCLAPTLHGRIDRRLAPYPFPHNECISRMTLGRIRVVVDTESLLRRNEAIQVVGPTLVGCPLSTRSLCNPVSDLRHTTTGSQPPWFQQISTDS